MVKGLDYTAGTCHVAQCWELAVCQDQHHSWETMGVDVSCAETVYVTSRHQTDRKHGLRNSGEGDAILITIALTIQQSDGSVKRLSLPHFIGAIILAGNSLNQTGLEEERGLPRCPLRCCGERVCRWAYWR